MKTIILLIRVSVTASASAFQDGSAKSPTSFAISISGIKEEMKHHGTGG